MSQKRITILTIAFLLFLFMYIYDNASVGDSQSWVNQKFWMPFHQANQWVSLIAIGLTAILLLVCIIMAFIPKKEEIPKQQDLLGLY